jgi:HEAT repeat protein
MKLLCSRSWSLVALGLALVLVLLTGCGKAEPEHRGKPLSYWLRAMDFDTRAFAKHAEAVDALVAIGQPAVPSLRALLDDVDIDKRIGAATALLRIDPQEELPDVRRRLEGEDPRLAISMAYGLIRANVSPELAVPVLARMLKDAEYYLHNQSIKALGELGPQSATAVPALAELLTHDGDPEVRWRAAFALVRIGPTATAAVPALREALADPDAKVREGAAYALGAVGPAAKDAAGALRVALNDADPQVRFRAAKALERL